MSTRRSRQVHTPAGEGRAVDLGSDAGVDHAWIAHSPGLRAYAFRRLGDRGLAEDAVQETFLRAWRKAGGFDAARGSVQTWLFAILRNLLVDMARARASRPQTSPIIRDVAAGDDVDRLLGSLTVADALRRLSPEHRHVIVQSYVTQRPHSEIAECLGVPVGTVRSRLFYAREALSNALRQIGAVEPGRARVAA